MRLQVSPHGSCGRDRRGGHQRYREGGVAARRRAWILRGRRQREEAPERDRDRDEVAEAGLVQQVHSPGAEVSRDEEGADQVPGAIAPLTPAERRAEELRPPRASPADPPASPNQP